MRLLDGVIIPCVPNFRIDSFEGRVLNQNSGNSGENDSRLGDLSVEAELCRPKVALFWLQSRSATPRLSLYQSVPLCPFACAQAGEGVIDENRLLLAF